MRRRDFFRVDLSGATFGLSGLTALAPCPIEVYRFPMRRMS
jgi:hypothetical protein